jgi:hypothetical protein
LQVSAGSTIERITVIFYNEPFLLMNRLNKSQAIIRALFAGFAGGIAWLVATMLFFGPAQIILANPDYQSPKFLYVVGQLEPLPYAAEAWWIIPAGLIIIGMLYGVVYHFVRRAFPGISWWKKGIRFGLVAWALMVPWFEFYLPWNVMHEPVMLVALEMVLWLAVLVIVGIVIAGIYERRVNADRK